MQTNDKRIKTIELGTGRLTWNRSERVSDRYGAVYLIAHGDSTSSGPIPTTLQRPPQEGIGCEVALKAEILETRESTHIGDFFRGLYPSTPRVGMVITLGLGALTVEGDKMVGFTVGVIPPDADDLALDPKALYRCHEQTVRLFAEELHDQETNQRGS